MEKVATAVRDLPKAALFELADDGYTSPFEQLVACILSIRTRDETMLPTARRLFQTARTPQQIAALGVAEIDALVRDCSFHAQKAQTIHALAVRVMDEFGGEMPCEYDVLVGFRGVGPKCANLTLGIACGTPKIGVDIHVHRVTNRWGYVDAASPEATLRKLEERLPKDHWIEINRVLVPFGKHVCRGRLPRCSTCPVAEMCAQVGVTAHA